MRILIAGAGGLIGSTVTQYLASCGYEVVRLVRKAPGPGEVGWDPDNGTIDAPSLEGFDGVIHVASLSWNRRWTAAFKQQMYQNRLRTNGLLAEALASRRQKPRVFVCASGQGIYPSSGDQILTEESALGTDYLANLQRDGEAATTSASSAGIRVVHLRLPMVLGGANIRRGMGRLGNGRQWVSWVALDELASIVYHILVTDALVGPVNPTSPKPMRNADVVTALGHALGRKPGPPIPAFLLRLMLGEMAEALLLASRRMEPHKLLATGYQFRLSRDSAAPRAWRGVGTGVLAEKAEHGRVNDEGFPT